MKFKAIKNKRHFKFIEKHRDCGYDDIGSQLEFSFIPTEIGVIYKIKCIHCGKKKIIEDVDADLLEWGVKE